MEIGRAVADIIITDDLQFAAARMLEDLDPNAQLTGDERDEWRALLDAVGVSVELNLEPVEELGSCRDALRAESSYAAVADALANPTSPRGRDLKTRLEDVRDSGVLGAVMRYNLTDLGSP